MGKHTKISYSKRMSDTCPKHPDCVIKYGVSGSWRVYRCGCEHY